MENRRLSLNFCHDHALLELFCEFLCACINAGSYDSFCEDVSFLLWKVSAFKHRGDVIASFALQINDENAALKAKLRSALAFVAREVEESRTASAATAAATAEMKIAKTTESDKIMKQKTFEGIVEEQRRREIEIEELKSKELKGAILLKGLQTKSDTFLQQLQVCRLV